MKEKSKRQIILIILFFILLITTTSINNPINNDTQTIRSYQPDKTIKLSATSPPIHIDNNWTAAVGAGIATGNGTYSNPYVIEDLVIDGGGTGTCIDILNSDVYFIIQNCTCYNSGVGTGPFYHAGIRFYNVSNGKLIDNNASNNGWSGIRLYYDCDNNTVIGNIETTKQITVYLDINNITTLINFAYYEDFSIKYVNNLTQFTLNWNDGTGSGLQNIYYKVDSESFSVYSTPFTLLGYSEGLHNITYYTIDNVGNIELEKSITIYLDITALDLNIFYNVIYRSNYIDENTSISITSIEDLGSGVKNVQYRIDEGTWINGTEFNLNGLTLGEHTIYYRVEDNIGNFRQKSEVVFLVTNESDIDDDGLTYQEEQNFSTDPFNDDTDGDKLLDGDEVNKYQTNPLSRDTDGDGYSDYDEIFVYGTDPNNALSSPTMNVIIIIIILSAISISGYLGVKKWKTIHRRRVEDKVITRISEDKIKVLDHNTLNERLQKVKSKLNFEEILKKSNVNGQYILNGTLYVKDISIEKFATLIEEMVKKIYDQNLSKREEVNLIKIGTKDLEQDEKLMEFIKKLKEERV